MKPYLWIISPRKSLKRHEKKIESNGLEIWTLIWKNVMEEFWVVVRVEIELALELFFCLYDWGTWWERKQNTFGNVLASSCNY